ncbi:MAG: trigger factor [Pyrinomonadaceae bacterium]|nr:trigger factor [Phycisphaerales bacterium]
MAKAKNKKTENQETTDIAEQGNKVEITDIGPCLKKISIEIPAEAVQSQLGSSIDTLLLEAELPGFRKGRAPRRLLEKKFGSTVKRESKNQLVAQAYSRAVEDNKLRVIGEPSSQMLDKIEIEEGKPLSFEIEVEVIPDFELPSLMGVSVRRPTMEVTDQMVTDEINRLGLHEGELQERDHAEKGDYLTGHAQMIDSDGKTHLDIQDAVIQIPPADKEGKGMILGIAVEDFGKQLGLPKAGETATIKTKGPEGHETEAVRGKDLTITFKVNRIDRILPASVEALTSKYGMQTEAELREAMKTRIDQKVRVDQATVMRQQVSKYLLDKVPMEMPERVTAMQSARNLSRRRMELIYRGLDPAQIEQHLADMRNTATGDAVRDLKIFFLMSKAAESLDIKVTEAEMNQQIAQMAWQRNMRPERLRQEIMRSDQGGTLFTQLREHKTMDAILGTAEITDMPAEEFNKWMAEENKAATK